MRDNEKIQIEIVKSKLPIQFQQYVADRAIMIMLGVKNKLYELTEHALNELEGEKESFVGA